MNSDKVFLGEGLVFILGDPHSGTTWTWDLLISHPEIETLLIEDFPEIETASGINLMKTKHGFVTSETTIFFSNLSDEEIYQGVLKKNNEVAGKFLCEKTPSNALRLDRLTNLFPKAKYLVLEHEPRSVTSSMLNTKFRSGRKFAGSRGLIDGYKTELLTNEIQCIESELKTTLTQGNYKTSISYCFDKITTGLKR